MIFIRFDYLHGVLISGFYGGFHLWSIGGLDGRDDRLRVVKIGSSDSSSGSAVGVFCSFLECEVITSSPSSIVSFVFSTRFTSFCAIFSRLSRTGL